MQAFRRTSRSLRGAFSLIELMVVVVILGLLAGVVMMTIGGETDDARVTVAKNQVRQLYDAIQSYRMMCEQRGIRPKIPDTLDGLFSGPPEWEGRWRPSLKGDSIPKDPWGNEYFYNPIDPEFGDFEIICYGADGREGGEGFDADIRQSTVND